LAKPPVAIRIGLAVAVAAIVLASFDLKLRLLTVDARWVSPIYRSVDLSAGELGVAVAAAALAVGHSRGDLTSPPHGRVDRWLTWLGFSLVGLLALSAISAVSPLLALGQTLAVTLGIVFVSQAVQVSEIRPWLRRACQIVVLVQTPFVILQELTQSTYPANTLLRGLPGETSAVTPGAWVVVGANGLRWQRALGTFQHPNILGGFLALAIILLLPRVAPRRQFHPTVIAVWLVAWLELLVTFSRAAVLAAVVGCVAWLITRAEHKGVARSKSLLVALIAIGVAASIGLLARAIVTGAGRGAAEPAVADRIALARIALGLISAHPVFGVGAANFSLVESLPPIDGAFVDPVHVVPLLVVAEAGILAGVTWLSLVLGPIVRAWWSRNVADADVGQRYAVGGVLMTLGLLDHYLWTISSGRIMFWVALVFLYARAPHSGIADD
jgi:hypothetical protein